MKIHQPMLFLGLGGTGCRVGRELERVLREALCGPDGTELIGRMRGHDYLPYQLPPCVQFVYADLSVNELSKVLPNVVPSADHHAAAQHTTHLIANLVPPNHHNSAQLAQSMRITMDSEAIGWLPGPKNDPRVAPLDAGAGQLPTVGRAVLFETIRQGSGPNAVLHGVTAAMQRINASGAAIHELGGALDNTLDVFVAFSVAGGTGCGIFLDYLYMVGEHVRQTGARARIHPLVLMPSAFEEGMGGGRAAVLNAGSALVDLFRLVDDQNAQGIEDEVGQGRRDRGPLSIRLPGEQNPISLRPATVQTAFLFGRPDDGVSGTDLIRSMVSLVTALVSAGPEGGTSFAEHFVNTTASRSALAETGVGRRGVSTAAVASLTIPLAVLADVVSSRLLAEAVRAMRVTPTAVGVQNRALIERFDTTSGLEGFFSCAPLESFAEMPDEPTGYDAIIQALNARARSMQDSLERNERLLGPHMGQVAKGFSPAKAAEELSRTIDPFQLRRLARGDAGYPEPLDRGGFDKVLGDRTEANRSPAGFDFGLHPPQPEVVRRRGVFRRLRWTDPSVREAIEEQDAWFRWRVRRQWNEAWGKNEQVWEPRWRSFCDQLTSITEEFANHVSTDDRQFGQRSAQLYASRLGVSYLLPPDDGGMSSFYSRVLATLTNRYSGRLGANPTTADIVGLILGEDGWLGAYRAGREKPEAAVHWVRQRIRGAVSECFRPGGVERPVIPAMQDLLASVVGRADSTVDDVDAAHFRNKLAGMVPGGYAPAGEGELRVLITYPASARDSEVEAFLQRVLLLPPDISSIEFRPNESDSLVVVLFRTSMGITQVPEVREAIRLRSEALRHEHSGDWLLWRQRLGDVTAYPVSTPGDRAVILQSFLSAMWNGWMEVDDSEDDQSPRRVRVRVGHPDAPPLALALTPFRELSSWASLVQAYEEWTLSDGSSTRRSLAGELTRTVPLNVDRDPAPPSPQFTKLLELQGKQLQLIDELRGRPGIDTAQQIDLMDEFWKMTLPAALDLPFRGVQSPFANLRGMADYFGRELSKAGL
ncbi:tubulin-like doman-containing protein [Actinokineospora pegani]|uniref:tubulin-like doman-containing protein n=1 Tax=Actinokineospora pegani TaxID=2654637 RepID=UPI0018D454F6|nr:tubulin-like doman-containing protein [Actinokineospora pegani]